jgi:hypothetical protein
MSARSWILLGAALGAPLLLRLPLPAVLAAVVALVLLGVLPGAAMARAVAAGDTALAALLTVVGSMAVTIGVSTVLLYARWWSATSAAAAVGLVTAIIVVWGERGRHHDLA